MTTMWLAISLMWQKRAGDSCPGEIVVVCVCDPASSGVNSRE